MSKETSMNDEKIILHQRKRNQKKSKKITTPQEISKRCCFGFPQVVLSSATKQNTTNKKLNDDDKNPISSTLFWITCPKLSSVISIIEANDDDEKKSKKKMRRKFFFLSGPSEESETQRIPLMNLILKKSYLNFAEFLYKNHQDLFFGWKDSSSSNHHHDENFGLKDSSSSNHHFNENFGLKDSSSSNENFVEFNSENYENFIEDCDSFFSGNKEIQNPIESIFFEKQQQNISTNLDENESAFPEFREYLFKNFGMRKFGNGGVSKRIEEIKCLHSHVSSFLAGANDLIGWLTCEKIIELKKNDENNEFEVLKIDDIFESIPQENLVSEIKKLEITMQNRKNSVFELIGKLFCCDNKPFCEKFL